MKRILSLALVLVLSLGLFVGCGSSEIPAETPAETTVDTPASTPAEPETKALKVSSSIQAEEICKSGIAELEKLGYTVEVMVFDDFQSPNRAVDEGSANFNFYQHIPFMTDFNNSNNTDLVMLEPVMWNFFLGLYSTKYDSIDDIPEGGLIGLGEDASSISMQMQYCADWGLFTLSDTPSDGEYYTQLDIIDNPKNLSFIHVGGAQRYASADEYDAYIGTSDELFAMGYDVNEGLLATRAEDEWALGIAVNRSDLDSQMVKDILAAYTSDSAIAYVTEKMGGSYVLTDIAKTALGK